MGLTEVQYNRFKLDCLWKGAIQQTETKQSKSIPLSSCHLYVRVVDTVGRDRGGFKRQREESVLGKRSHTRGNSLEASHSGYIKCATQTDAP